MPAIVRRQAISTIESSSSNLARGTGYSPSSDSPG
jgi:hypothetical protein